MSSAKCRPFCLGLNACAKEDFHLIPSYTLLDYINEALEHDNIRLYLISQEVPNPQEYTSYIALKSGVWKADFNPLWPVVVPYGFRYFG